MAESEKDVRESDSKSEESEDNSSIGVVEALRIVAGLLLISCIASYFVTGDSVTWNYRPWWIRPKALTAWLRSPVILTDDQLLQYDGRDESLPLYLALNGTIYDVSAGRRIYSPGGPYNFFAGRDATRGYITGCFKEDSIADYRGVEWTFVPRDVPTFTEKSDQELNKTMRDYRYEMVGLALEEVDKTITHWAKMFRGDGGKDYFEVGYVKRDPEIIARSPLKALCANAEKKRPKPKFDETREYGKSEAARRARRQQRGYAKSRNPVLSGEAQKAAGAGAGAGAGDKGHDEI